MNLHNIAGPCVAAVNPWIVGQYKQSNGTTQNTDYSRSPSFAAPVSVQIQMQALTYKDLQQIDGLNINGEAQAMYINGSYLGVSRPDSRGGDVITLPDSSVWLCVHVLENWYRTDGWTKIAVVRQNGA